MEISAQSFCTLMPDFWAQIFNLEVIPSIGHFPACSTAALMPPLWFLAAMLLPLKVPLISDRH